MEPTSSESCPSSTNSDPGKPTPRPHQVSHALRQEYCVEYVPFFPDRPPWMKDLSFRVFPYTTPQAPYPQNVHTEPFPRRRCSSKARLSTSCTPATSTPATDFPSQPMSATSDPKRRTPRSIDLWDDNSTIVLLTHFLSQWQAGKNGNLRMKDWEDVTLSVNLDLKTTFNVSQVKNRVDTVRKAYRKESLRAKSSGGVPSSWPFYTFAERIWGKSLKITDLPGGFNGETFHDEVEPHASTPIDVDDVPCELPPASPTLVKTSDEKDYAAPKVHNMKMQRVIGKKGKTSRLAPIGLLGKEISTSMKEFTESMERLEEKRMEFEMRMYEMRLKEDSARQEKQYEMRLKEETIRQEKQLAAQVAIAKLFSGKQHQESASSEE